MEDNIKEAPSVCRAQQILVDLKERRESFTRALASHPSLGKMVTVTDSPKAPRLSLKPPPSPSTSTSKTTRANEILLDMKRKKVAISSAMRNTLPSAPPMSPCKSSSHSNRRSDYSSPTTLTTSTTMSSISPNTDHGNRSFCYLVDTTLHETGNDKELNSESSVEVASEAPSMASRKPPEKSTTSRQGNMSTELAALLRSSMTWEIPSEQLNVSSRKSSDKECLSIPSVPDTLHENGSMHDWADRNVQKKEPSLRLADGGSITRNITRTSSVDLRDVQKKQDLVRGMIESLAEIRKKQAANERMAHASSRIESRTSQLLPVLSRYLEKAQSSPELQTTLHDSQHRGSASRLSSYLEKGYPRFEDLKSKSRRSLGAASAMTLDSATSVSVASNYILPLTPQRPRRKILIKPGNNFIAAKLKTPPMAPTPSPTDLPGTTNKKIAASLYMEPLSPETTFSEPCFQLDDERDRRSDGRGRRPSSSRKKRKPRPPGLPRTISVIKSSQGVDCASADDSMTSEISNTSSRACRPSKQAQELVEKLDAILSARDAMSTLKPLTRDVGGQWCGGLYHLAVRSGMDGTAEQEV